MDFQRTALYISIICIIGTEFWERFSFCGLRTILSLYLRNELQLNENSATIVYHVFIMLCYIIPVVGAFCADSFLGRYRTIFYFSLIYIVGNVIMIFAAIPTVDFSPIASTIIGLGLIAIGTGGTKPCVAAFGGDQFRLPVEQDKLQQFFSLFYFSINLGGFVGMILTPILRKAVRCFGDDTCYALGFGFPAILMVLSLLLFVLGKPWYRMKSPKGNIMLEFANCTMYALFKKMKSRRDYHNHWLDSAKGKFNSKLIHDMKIVYAVLLLYTPLPLFWSLFDQQGSRWTFQASRMNGFVLGMQIVPDQMQVVNPALVLFLIPFFDKCLYPLLTRHRVLESHLHRMAIGGMVAGLAFLCAGFLELILERNYPKLPGNHQAAINIINTLPCAIDVRNPFNTLLHLKSRDTFRFVDVPAHNNSRYDVLVITPQQCGPVSLAQTEFKMSVLAIEHQVDTILIGFNKNWEVVDFITDPIEFKRSLSGKPRLRIVFLKRTNELRNVTVSFQNTGTLTDIYFLPDIVDKEMLESDYLELPTDGYQFTVQANMPIRLPENDEIIHLALGGVYTLVLSERDRFIEFSKLYTMSPPNDVNIMWLLPQYFLISIAEIMFGIAGLEFSFTQAPKSMKTVTIAAWYLSVAFGNFLVIIITQASIFKSQAYEFFLFAVLIVGDMMMFTQMASKYHYVELEADSSVFLLDHRGSNYPYDDDDDDSDTDDDGAGIANPPRDK